MRITPSGNRRRQLLAALMLAAFAVRALVPAGFMPAGGGAFSIEICPEGFSAQPLSQLPHGGHHHPGGSPTHTEHCVFGSAGASGPVRQLAALGALALLQHAPAARFIAAPTAVRLVHLPQARGPPAAT
jgi:hypothetical protein